MIGEEREPAFGWIAAAPHAPKISGYSALGDLETELLKFSVNLGRPPIRVLFRQAPNQNTNLVANLRPATARTGPLTPVQLKARPMPADDGLRLHDDEGLGPAGPNLPQGGPEQPVEGGQRWSQPFALEHSYLLSEGEDFESGVTATVKEYQNGRQD